LELCLESLAGQIAAREIVVADCSPADPSGALAGRFPNVRFLHFAQPMTVPELRWAAFRETECEVVAAVEARCVPAADWCAQLAAAHRQFPSTPAIGGPVGCGEPASAMARALYFCEYGLYAPPVVEGPSPDLSGANLSYKREALSESRDLLDAGKWETLLHARWREQGRMPRLSQATVVFHNSMTPAVALRQRYWYGRGYAADRVENRPRLVALALAFLTPALPIVLTWRLWKAAGRGHARPQPRAWPWILLLQSAWALGECGGYFFDGFLRAGGPRRARIF
jgi:hypothetical protein